jgi:hypothetical protein
LAAVAAAQSQEAVREDAAFEEGVKLGTAMTRPLRRGLFSRVGLVAGPALPAAVVAPTVLRDKVAGLLAP